MARSLVSAGHSVTALVRDSGSEKAAALKSLGVSLAVGDFDDPSSLTIALNDQEALFAVATPFTDGVESEVRNGKALVDAAIQMSTEHVVYSSVAGADIGAGVPIFESKSEIEEHLSSSGLNWTITAPVYFMDNMFLPWKLEELRHGMYRQPLGPQSHMQQIAVEDIGKINAAVIEGGESFYGRRIEIAGDDITGIASAAILTEAVGHHVQYVEQPISEIKAVSEDIALMYEWIDGFGYQVDIGALKAEFPDLKLKSFYDWTHSADWDSALEIGPEISMQAIPPGLAILDAT